MAGVVRREYLEGGTEFVGEGLAPYALTALA